MNEYMYNNPLASRCKAQIWVNFQSYRCSRKPWKDGYCKQHHPDNVKKRQEESRARYEEKIKNSLPYKLEQANKRIEELEKEIQKLKGERE